MKLRTKSTLNISPKKSPIKKAGSKYSKIKKSFKRPEMKNTQIGQVFVVGSGDCAQLGLGPDVFEKAKFAKLSFFDELEVVDVVAGGLHNMALCKNGKLYSWGCNDQKALGRSGDETVPGMVEGLENVFVVSVECGDSITVALSSDGRVYAWGTFRGTNGIFGFAPGIEVQAEPYLIPDLKYITGISCGTNHILAIGEDGKIYSWGIGEQGQLGRKVMSRHAFEASLIPRPINFRPAGHRSAKFTQVFTGGYHSALLLSSNDLYSFGLNNYGQLGVGDLEVHEFPMPVVGMDDMASIKAVDGGEHFGVILKEDGIWNIYKGRVYVCGRNDSGQLGLESTKYPEHSSKAVQLALPPISEISCGAAFTLAVTKTRDLYAWGYGEMGQLANNNEDAPIPFQVELKDRKVLRAAGGGQHTVLLLEPKV